MADERAKEIAEDVADVIETSLPHITRPIMKMRSFKPILPAPLGPCGDGRLSYDNADDLVG